MAVAVLFWTFILAACLLVFWRGNATERAFTVFLLFSTGASFALNARFGIFEAQNAILAVDVAIMGVALAIMRGSDAHWPVWFAGFQSIIVATGLARLLVPSAVPGDYINAAGFWALPAVLALVLGTLADHRMRTAASGRT